VLVTLIFTLTAAGWVFQPLLARHFALVTDTTIAMTGALLLFLTPANPRRGEFLMRWEDTKGLPWDVLLLFGGGLSLAGNIEKHGLARFLGDLSQALDGWPMLLTLCVLTFGILMLTELTSNTATAASNLATYSTPPSTAGGGTRHPASATPTAAIPTPLTTATRRGTRPPPSAAASRRHASSR
jgi:sodium-dependent dicarboxylate transporter 2/3/5